MKKYIHSLIILMFFNFCLAQSDVSTTPNQFINAQWVNMSMGSEVFWTKTLSDNPDLINDIKQSGLIDLNWEKAKMEINENFQVVEARYNPFNDVIEVKQDGKIFEFAKVNNRNIKFIDTDVTYQAKSFYGSDGKIYTSYFIVNNLADDTALLKKEWLEQNPDFGKRLNTYMNVVIVSEQFKKKDYYYFIDDDNRLCYLTTNRSFIKNMYPDNAEFIWKFIRANKLKSDDENDMMTLAKYIKTLKSENTGM